MPSVSLQDFIAAANTSPLVQWQHLSPWELISQSEFIVREVLKEISPEELSISNEVAVHKLAIIDGLIKLICKIEIWATATLQRSI